MSEDSSSRSSDSTSSSQSSNRSSGRSERFIKMTTAPVERLVLGLAGPSMAIMMATSFYNMAATYFVSHLGTSEVAAVGIAFPLMNIIQAIGFFFGQGSGNYMSRALGAQDTERASRMAVTALVSGFAMMAITASIILFNLDSFVMLLGATETIQPHAMEYIFFILLASPWMVAATILNQQLRFQGSAAIAMIGMTSGTLLNIALTPVMIFVFGLGIRGASLSTMICQMTSFFILFFYGTTRKGNVRIRFSHFSPSPYRYIETCRGGVPSLIRQGLMSVATITINHFARPFGDAAIAAISIASRITMFANSLAMGFGQGFQPICGFNYGAKLYSRVRKAFWFCVRTNTIFLFAASIVMAIFAPEIIAFFRDDPEVIRIGTVGLRLHCVGLPFLAAALLVNMMTQTMGRALEASITAFSRQGFVLIPSLFILSPIFGLRGIQMSIPIADIASMLIAIPIFLRVYKILSVPDAPSENPVFTGRMAGGEV